MKSVAELVLRDILNERKMLRITDGGATYSDKPPLFKNSEGGFTGLAAGGAAGGAIGAAGAGLLGLAISRRQIKELKRRLKFELDPGKREDLEKKIAQIRVKQARAALAGGAVGSVAGGALGGMAGTAFESVIGNVAGRLLESMMHEMTRAETDAILKNRASAAENAAKEKWLSTLKRGRRNVVGSGLVGAAVGGLVGGGGTYLVLRKKMNALKQQIEQERDPYKRDILEERLRKLRSRVVAAGLVSTAGGGASGAIGSVAAMSRDGGLYDEASKQSRDLSNKEDRASALRHQLIRSR